MRCSQLTVQNLRTTTLVHCSGPPIRITSYGPTRLSKMKAMTTNGPSGVLSRVDHRIGFLHIRLAPDHFPFVRSRSIPRATASRPLSMKWSAWERLRRVEAPKDRKMDSLPLCAREVVIGPRLMGEKPTSPGNLGVNGWVVIRAVIVPDTAFPMKVGSFLAPGYSLLQGQELVAAQRGYNSLP